MPETSADDDYARVLAAYREDYHRLYAWRALAHGERVVDHLRLHGGSLRCLRAAADMLKIFAQTGAQKSAYGPGFVSDNTAAKVFPERAAVLAVMAFCVWVWGDEEKRKAGLPSR